MLDVQIVQGEMDSVEADCLICPLDKDFHVVDSSCISLFNRISFECIYDSYSLKQTKSNVSVYVLKIPDPQKSDKIIYFPLFFEDIHIMKFVPFLNRIKECKSIAIPLAISPDDLSRGNRSLLRHFLQVLFSESRFPGVLRQITLVTCDEVIFDAGKKLINEFEDIRKKREEERVLQEKEYMLRKGINRCKLNDCIMLLLNTNKIEWTPGRILEDGVRTFAYPNYPHELFEIFHLMDVDSNYPEHVAEIRKLGIKPNQLTLLQIQTYLTYLQRGERFCNGMIADDVNKGILLSVLFRLYELLYSEQYWERWI